MTVNITNCAGDCKGGLGIFLGGGYDRGSGGVASSRPEAAAIRLMGFALPAP